MMSEVGPMVVPNVHIAIFITGKPLLDAPPWPGLVLRGPFCREVRRAARRNADRGRLSLPLLVLVSLMVPLVALVMVCWHWR